MNPFYEIVAFQVILEEKVKMTLFRNGQFLNCELENACNSNSFEKSIELQQRNLDNKVADIKIWKNNCTLKNRHIFGKDHVQYGAQFSAGSSSRPLCV